MICEEAMEATTRTLQYRDTFGYLQTIIVTSKEHRAIETIWRQAQLADQRWRQRHVAFTDLGAQLDAVEEVTARPSQQGNAWEGPRFSFAHLIGEGQVWQGKGEDFCQGRKLRLDEYCLGCDRSGRDLVIPSGQDRRTRNHRGSGLRGGCEGKQ